MNKIKALLALALILPAPALSQSPRSAPGKKQPEVERIVGSTEFKAAAQKRDIALMTQLLQGTGAVASEPVAIIYCHLPTTPTYINGSWHCVGGNIDLPVHPYMYMQ